MRLIARLLIVLAGLMGTAALAQATTVNCSAGQTLGNAINALPPAPYYASITVSGACHESVTIPPGILVSITGAAGASLTPPAGSTGFYVIGKLNLTNLSIVGNASGYNAIFVDQGAYAQLTALRITGSADGVDFAHGASGRIINSVVTVTSSQAIGLFGAGTVEIDAFAAVDGVGGTTLSGSSYGVNCSQGTLLLNASGGNLVINNAGVAGVQAGPCTASTSVASGSKILISGNYIGVFAKVGGSVVITGGVTIGNSSNSAINTQQNGVVSIFNFSGGVNTIYRASGNTNVLFSCYQGGKIYVQQIAGYITPAPTSADQGCLQVGGP